MITRAEVIRRASTLWKAGTVPYSQNAIEPRTGYRQDCSGFVSMCWGIPANAAPGGWGGLNTVTLVSGGWMHEIPPADLRPGDAVGICGPGSAGDAGHIVIFERWVNDDPNNDDYWLWEQAGGRSGPTRRVLTYPYGGPWGQWKAYRFRDISDATPPTPPTPDSGGGIVPNQFDAIKDVVLFNGPPQGTRLGDVWGRTLGNAESAKAAAQAAQAGVAELLGRPATVSIELRPEDVDRIAAQVAERVTDAVAQAVVDKLTAWFTR